MANFVIREKPGPPSLLVRPRPDENGNFVAFATQNDGFGVYIHQEVLDFIERESRRAAPNEVIGLLAGRICRDLQRVPYTLVMAAEGAIGDEADAGPGHVHISPDGRARVRRRLEAAHPDREIVGWYHSHPNHEAQFSPVDATEQSAWPDANHVGIVFSGRERDEPFGVYRGPGAIRLLRRRAESRANATEQTQPDRAKLPAVVNAQTGRVPAVRRVRSGRLIGAALRLLAVLVVLGFAAGVVWLHVRVRAVENALGDVRGMVQISRAQAAPAETPTPQQPPPSSDTGPQISIVPEADTKSVNRTALTDGPAVTPAANPLNKKALGNKNRRAGKNRTPGARGKNSKNSETTNTKPAEARPVNQ